MDLQSSIAPPSAKGHPVGGRKNHDGATGRCGAERRVKARLLRRRAVYRAGPGSASDNGACVDPAGDWAFIRPILAQSQGRRWSGP